MELKARYRRPTEGGKTESRASLAPVSMQNTCMFKKHDVNAYLRQSFAKTKPCTRSCRQGAWTQSVPHAAAGEDSHSTTLRVCV